MFIKNLPEDAENNLVERILKECGTLTQFKRAKGTAFGHCEFENLEGALKCLRLVNNRRLIDKYLLVKSHEKGEILLQQWLN